MRNCHSSLTALIQPAQTFVLVVASYHCFCILFHSSEIVGKQKPPETSKKSQLLKVTHWTLLFFHFPSSSSLCLSIIRHPIQLNNNDKQLTSIVQY